MTLNVSLCLLAAAVGSCLAVRNLTFPEGFMFGASTASYQVEGAWNTSGKGESIWDRIVHTKPQCFRGRATGDVTADSYHRYKEDVKALKDTGLGFYRFSISWARILPTGDIANVNQDGVNYYNNLINELLANNIQPLVTMYHWDLPQHLQEFGGMSNNVFVDYFEDYAHFLYTHFGDRVKWWITFNEPLSLVGGYSSDCSPPAVIAPGVGAYYVGHNLLKAHARAYHVYDKLFRGKQKGKIGITLNADYGISRTNSTRDMDALKQYYQMNMGWFAHPIFSSEGDYPTIMKERIADLSRAEGLRRSRLPEFSKDWIDQIKGSADFFGLNVYTARLVSAIGHTGQGFADDMANVRVQFDPSWPRATVSWLTYTPFAMRGMLNWVRDEYGDGKPIIITENGWSDHGEMNDTMRTRYFMNYLAALLDAVHIDKVNVIGHTAWSLIDNFEWNFGYTAKFGFYSVDYSDDARPRTAKHSASVYASMIQKGEVLSEYLDKE